MPIPVTGEITDEEGAQEIAEDNEANALYNFVRVEKQNNSESVQRKDGTWDNKVSKMSPDTNNSGFWPKTVHGCCHFLYILIYRKLYIANCQLQVHLNIEFERKTAIYL